MPEVSGASYPRFLRAPETICTRLPVATAEGEHPRQVVIGRQRLVNVRFGSHDGPKSDIAPSPRSAKLGNWPS
jgi:hypothetical protein